MISTQNYSKDLKIVVVLNKTTPIGRVLNAACHTCLTLSGTADDEGRQQMFFQDYVDGGNDVHRVSGLSLIVLRAKNSNQVKKVRDQAMGAGLHCVDFIESMTQGSYADQMKRTAELAVEDLDYWAVGVFGEKEVIDPITKRLSLWT